MLDKIKQTGRDATLNAKYFEYTKAADPAAAGLLSPVPYKSFMPDLYSDGSSRVIPLDLSTELGAAWPCTGPGLMANFIRINKGDSLALSPVSTSQLFYVISGSGSALQGEDELHFTQGAFLALPGGLPVYINASSNATFYYVNDEPLMRYLGAESVVPRFEATLFPADETEKALREVSAEEGAAQRSRISVLLGNSHFPQTRTVTHVLWAMYGLLPAGAVQKPHRHQSVALDFIVEAPEGCYTLVGKELDEAGRIINPVKVKWESGMAFVTPPGYWHAHYNESGKSARLIPVQDAGLQTWLRALDIRFS